MYLISVGWRMQMEPSHEIAVSEDDDGVAAS
jgi:hypothetical protein